MILPIDLSELVLHDLPDRLIRQAKNIGEDGWCAAERLMINAADALNYLIELGVIEIETEKRDD